MASNGVRCPNCGTMVGSGGKSLCACGATSAGK
jgi:hypothetical protein